MALEPRLESLDLVPSHRQVDELSRWVFPGIPLLVSVHEITDAEPMHRDYCDEHVHEDKDEVLIVLGVSDDFAMDVVVGDRSHEVGPKAAAFVPAGTVHAANVVAGTGFLVTLQSSRAGTPRPSTPNI